MKTSDRGIAALIAHEGVVPGPYRDSKGIWTYGVGHTMAAGKPDPAGMARGMPADLDAALVEVFRVFRRDLERYEEAVNKAIKVPVTQHEFDAAVSFHYNTGAIGRATWVRTLNKGDRTKAAKEMMNWRKPPEIIGRREDERRLFQFGTYPDADLTVWQVDSNGGVIWKPARRLEAGEALALMRGGVRPDPIHHDDPTEQPGISGPAVAIGGGIAAVFAALAAGACKIPFLASLINSCGG